MDEESFIGRLRQNPLFRSFLFYSAFRAVYGFGILLVAYFFATSTDAPWWATILIFIASMIFSYSFQIYQIQIWCKAITFRII